MGLMRHEASVTVHRPIEEVWTYLTDSRNLTRWSPAWFGARVTSPGPLELGTTFQGRRTILGVLPLRWTGVVTEWDPPQVFSFAVKVLGAQSTVRLTLTVGPEGVMVTRIGQREPRMAQKLASRIFGRWLRHHHDARDEVFRRFVESGLR
ncbi:UNVERIFIED_ORG: uncharacterized protein YndB with AHSA1/START domain [Arthrobacter sp. UYCu721]